MTPNRHAAARSRVFGFSNPLLGSMAAAGLAERRPSSGTGLYPFSLSGLPATGGGGLLTKRLMVRICSEEPSCFPANPSPLFDGRRAGIRWKWPELAQASVSRESAAQEMTHTLPVPRPSPVFWNRSSWVMASPGLRGRCKMVCLRRES